MLGIALACVPPSLGQIQNTVPAIEAEVETRTVRHLGDGNVIDQSVRTRYFRDTWGRTRLETPYSVAISDPVSRWAAVLDPRRQVARRMALPPLPRTELSINANRSGPGEDLGARVIDGVEVEGRLYTVTIPQSALGNLKPLSQTHEIWFSKEYQFPMLRVSRDALNGESTVRVVRINRVIDIPKETFAIPDSYAIEIVQGTPSSAVWTPDAP
jgi:hypothetical protein